jgi:hypothetical protein
VEIQASETLADGICHQRLAGKDGSDWLRSPSIHRGDIVPRRSSRGWHPTRGPRRWWSAGVARACGTLSVQAAGNDPVRVAKAT